MFEDRRNHVTLNLDEWVVHAQFVMNEVPDLRISAELLATVGARVAVLHLRWSGTVASGGPFALEMLHLVEVNGEGKIVVVIELDPAERNEAITELIRRFYAGEAAACATEHEPFVSLLEAFNRRDWASLRAVLADDFTVEDLRSVRIGRIEGADEFVSAVQTFETLSPDNVMEPVACLEWDLHGVVALVRSRGHGVGGSEFENVYAAVFRTDRGRVTCMENYDAADAQRALDRFEELRPRTPGIAPNTATRAFEQIHAAFVARDSEGYRACCAEQFVFEDRPNHLVLSIDQWVADTEFVMTGIPDLDFTTELVATAGDRIALVEVHWIGTVANGGPFTADVLHVLEVDDGGELVAVLKLELTDLHEASGEALRRFAAGEGIEQAGTAHVMARFAEAVTSSDWVAWRATLDDSFVLHDRRSAGLGVIDGPDAWVESQRVMAELSRDVTILARELLRDRRPRVGLAGADLGDPRRRRSVRERAPRRVHDPRRPDRRARALRRRRRRSRAGEVRDAGTSRAFTDPEQPGVPCLGPAPRSVQRRRLGRPPCGLRAERRPRGTPSGCAP